MNNSFLLRTVILAFSLFFFVKLGFAQEQIDCPNLEPVILKSPDATCSSCFPNKLEMIARSRMRLGYPTNKITVDFDEYLFYALKDIPSNSYYKVDDYLKQIEVTVMYKGKVYKDIILADQFSSDSIRGYGFKFRELLTRTGLKLNGEKSSTQFPYSDLSNRSINDLDVTLTFVWKSKKELPIYVKFNEKQEILRKKLDVQKKSCQAIIDTLLKCNQIEVNKILGKVGEDVETLLKISTNKTNKGGSNNLKSNLFDQTYESITKDTVSYDNIKIFVKLVQYIDSIKNLNNDFINLAYSLPKSESFSTELYEKRRDLVKKDLFVFKRTIANTIDLLKSLSKSRTPNQESILHFVNVLKNNLTADSVIVFSALTYGINGTQPNTSLFKCQYSNDTDTTRRLDAYSFTISKFGLIALIDFAPLSTNTDKGTFSDAISGLFKNLSKTSVDYAYINRSESFNNLLFTVPAIKVKSRNAFWNNIELEALYAVNSINKDKNTGWGLGLGLLGTTDKALKIGMVYFENEKRPNLYLGLSLRGVFGFLSGINELH